MTHDPDGPTADGVGDADTAVAADVDQRAALAVPVALVIAICGSLLAVVAWIQGWSERWFGIGLAVALTGIGVALVTWSKSLPLERNRVEQRHPLCLDEEGMRLITEEYELTRETFGRRRMVTWLAGGSLGTLLVGILTPLLDLGPAPKSALQRTSWAAGRRLVTPEGDPIAAESGQLDQLSTVFPEGHTEADDSQAVLLRLAPGLLSETTVEGGSLDGWVAYSKICTHLGCSVGLFGIDSRPPNTVRQLVCPCHQSVFDPTDAAQPIGGPAPRALPQLPLDVDDEGYLVATGDFPAPVGPLTWNDAGPWVDGDTDTGGATGGGG